MHMHSTSMLRVMKGKRGYQSEHTKATLNRCRVNNDNTQNMERKEGSVKGVQLEINPINTSTQTNRERSGDEPEKKRKKKVLKREQAKNMNKTECQ